jgi:hypothetical protein
MVIDKKLTSNSGVQFYPRMLRYCNKDSNDSTIESTRSGVTDNYDCSGMNLWIQADNVWYNAP